MDDDAATLDGAHLDAGAADDAQAALDAGTAFQPEHCRFTPLAAADVCRGATPCTVTLAAELSCARVVSTHDVVLTREHVFARLGVVEGQGSAQLLARLDLALQRAELVVPTRNIDAQLHAIPDAGVGLLTYQKGHARSQQLRQFPDVWSDSVEGDFPGDLAAAIFDAEGRPHIFSVGSSDAGQGVFDTALPGAPSYLFKGYAPYARALSLPDRTLALFYSRGSDAAPEIVRWTEAQGLRSVLAVPASSPASSDAFAHSPLKGPPWAALPLDADTTRVVYLQDQQLFSDAAPATALSSWSPLPSGCSEQRRVNFPDICPNDEQREALGEQPLSFGLARSARGPLLLTLIGNATRLCNWRTGGGCFETLPCDCLQTPAFQVGGLWLQVQPLSEPTRAFRIPLAGASSAWLRWTEEIDGALIVALNLNPGIALPSRTLFLRLDTR